MRTIPEISNEHLAEMLGRLTPVEKVGDGEYREILTEKDPQTSRGIAYTWNKVLTGEPIRLETSGQTETYHSWGYYGFFKPSLAEVMACSREKIPEGATHFWMDMDSPDRGKLLVKPDGHSMSGYHHADVYWLREA